MSHDPLAPIWTRLDCEPPVFFADRPGNPPADWMSLVSGLGLLRKAEPARVAVCLACGGGHVRSVKWVEEPGTGARRAYLPCPNCGLVRVEPERLERWAVDVPHLLAGVFAAAGGRAALGELVPGRLWYLGTATWLGRSRQAYFVRAAHTRARPAVLAALNPHPRAVLFHPTEHALRVWGEATANPGVALESVVSLTPEGLRFGTAVVEGLLEDAGYGEPREEPAPKRASRAESIARLTAEVIAHLRRARAHALATRDLSGEAVLLERPTKKLLGELVGLDPYEVTRCFKDETARELRYYWEKALDPDYVMQFTGPASTGPGA